MGNHDYLYDDNGNMVKDANKDITDIEYNHLNLPETVTFGNGDKVNYSYDAAGVKLRKVFSPDAGSNDTTDYVGGFHYSNSTIEFVQTVEGRYVFGTENEFQYHLKDHLGNTRATVRDDNGSVEVIGRDDYYPFGGAFNSFTRSFSTAQNYKFQEQEHDETTGWIQFKWRNHQPEVGRFFNIDPLAEDYYDNSPYAFSENSVIRYVELEGLEKIPFEFKTKVGKKPKKFESLTGQLDMSNGKFFDRFGKPAKHIEGQAPENTYTDTDHNWPVIYSTDARLDVKNNDENTIGLEGQLDAFGEGSFKVVLEVNTTLGEPGEEWSIGVITVSGEMTNVDNEEVGTIKILDTEIVTVPDGGEEAKTKEPVQIYFYVSSKGQAVQISQEEYERRLNKDKDDK